MTTIELQDSLNVKHSRRGSSGTRQWLCDWSVRYTDSLLPHIGTSFTSGLTNWNTYDDTLVCTDIDYSGAGCGVSGNEYKYCKVTASYATVECDLGYTTSWETDVETLEIGGGRTWTSDSVISDVPLSVNFPCPILIVNVTCTSDQTHKLQIADAVNCVNNASWLGISAGKLLFLQASTETWRGFGLDRISYRFKYNKNGHNTIWRAGQQAKNSNGSLIYDANGVPVILNQGKWDSFSVNIFDSTNFANFTKIG